jgi:predicted transcriptional regulator
MNAVTIRLPDKLAKDLDQAVKQERSTRSSFLREALEAYLRRRREASELEKYKEAARHLKRPWDDQEEDLWTIAANEALDNVEGFQTGEPEPKPFPAKHRRKR